jgi:hypothetical protein
MDNNQNQEAQDLIDKPEDAALEQEALSDVKEDAIRAEVIEYLGIADVDENAEYIDKGVAREKEHRQKLATAIQQKKRWREKAQTLKPPAEERPIVSNQSKHDVEDVSKLVDERLNAHLDDEKLRETELSDEGKKELKAYAKAQGITARQALSSDYFTFLKGKEESKNREEDASVSRSSKTPAKTHFDPDKPPTITATDPESVKKYEEWFNAVSEAK